MRQAGATLHRGARASHCHGLSCCGAQAPDAQAQQLWLTGLVAPRHVGSSRTRARTRVPCTGRQILNHCATREALCQPVFIMAILEYSHNNSFNHSVINPVQMQLVDCQGSFLSEAMLPGDIAVMPPLLDSQEHRTLRVISPYFLLIQIMLP